jgi:hypothetical protein
MDLAGEGRIWRRGIGSEQSKQNESALTCIAIGDTREI